MPEILPPASQETSAAQDSARIALGAMLALAGTSHLTFARKPFRAQVPEWVPMDPDTVVLQSGVVEIALGAALIAAPRRHRSLVGLAAAGFFTAIFPGNVSQYLHHRDAFGLDTDGKRFARLFFQPALVAWALWSTGAWLSKARHGGYDGQGAGGGRAGGEVRAGYEVRASDEGPAGGGGEGSGEL